VPRPGRRASGRADGVDSPLASRQLAGYEKNGFGDLPVDDDGNVVGLY